MTEIPHLHHNIAAWCLDEQEIMELANVRLVGVLGCKTRGGWTWSRDHVRRKFMLILCNSLAMEKLQTLFSLLSLIAAANDKCPSRGLVELHTEKLPATFNPYLSETVAAAKHRYTVLYCITSTQFICEHSAAPQ